MHPRKALYFTTFPCLKKTAATRAMVSPLGVGAAWLAPPGAKPPGYEVTVGRSMLRL